MADASPLLPRTQADAAPYSYAKNMIKALYAFGTRGTSILILIPIFKGQKCPAMPSALAFAITFAVLGTIQAPMIAYHNMQMIRLKMPTGFEVKLVDGVVEDYKGQKVLHHLMKWLGLTTLVLGLLWGFPMAMNNIHLMHEDDPATCEKSYFMLVFIASVICLSIFVLIIVYVLYYVLSGKKKKSYVTS